MPFVKNDSVRCSGAPPRYSAILAYICLCAPICSATTTATTSAVCGLTSFDVGQESASCSTDKYLASVYAGPYGVSAYATGGQISSYSVFADRAAFASYQ